MTYVYKYVRLYVKKSQLYNTAKKSHCFALMNIKSKSLKTTHSLVTQHTSRVHNDDHKTDMHFAYPGRCVMRI